MPPTKFPKASGPASAATGGDSPERHPLVARTISELLRLGGGKLAPPAQVRERLERCRTCPLVSPDFRLFGVVVPGGRGVAQCTPCGCIAVAKAALLRYFSARQGRVVAAACPHPDGSRWADVDAKYPEPHQGTEAEPNP